MGSLILQTTSPDYSVAATLSQPGAVRAFVQVFNALVYYQLDQSADGAGAWGDELPLGTVIASLGRSCSGVRFRSAKSNAAAIVCAELLTNPDLAGGGDSVSPNTITISPDGSISPGSGVFGLSTGDCFYSDASVDRQGALLCDGRSLNAIADPTLVNLWNEIGLRYGGTSESNFFLPDGRGRTLVGVAPTGHVDVNATGKNDGVALANRTPKHATSITDPGHAHAVTDPNHGHGVTDPGHDHVAANQSGGTGAGAGGGNFLDIETTSSNFTGVTVNAAATGVTVNGAATGITAGAGAGRPVDQVPFLALNMFMVK